MQRLKRSIIEFINQNKYYLAIASVSLLLMLLYLSITPWDVRHHDAFGHADYFQMIVREKRLPGSGECAQCYHPPLYYFTVIPIYLFARLTGMSHMILIQLFSVLLMQAFLFFSYLFYKLLFLNKKQYIAAFAMTAFWPGVILHSVRIGNDLMLYPIFVLGLLMLLKWVKSRKVNLFALSVVTALSIAVKSGGYALLLIFAIVLLIKNHKHLLQIKNWPGYLWKLSPVIFIVLLLFARKLSTSANTPWPVENVSGMDEKLKITNEVSEYAVFDIGKYLFIPFTDPWNYEIGSSQYWNYLLKTMIWGEFSFSDRTLQVLAIVIQSVFSVLLIFAVLGFIHAIRKRRYSYIFCFSLGILLICFSILARILSPYVTSGDFRYIFPGLISFISAVIYITEFKLGFIPRIFSYCLIILSVLFIFSLGFFYR